LNVPQFLYGSRDHALLSQHLATKGLLEAFIHQICLVRVHFGHYEPIDLLVLLIGYAISRERVDTSGAARPQQA
jgi:hypothetical protein